MVERRLFHVSDRPGITRFEPRPAGPQNPGIVDRPVVWTIDERLLHNYLLPRDCPRVTFYARPDSDAADVARFFGHTAARYVVAIETGWLAGGRPGGNFIPIRISGRGIRMCG